MLSCSVWLYTLDIVFQIDRLKAHIEKVERELKEEKEKNAYIEKQRKDSIHNLHNNMFQKLLDAEFEYEEEIERLHREKQELNDKIVYYEEQFNHQEQEREGGASSVNPTEVIQLRDELKTKDQIIEDNKQRIFQLTKDLEAKEINLQNEQKQRRSSVSFLSKQMMAKLLEAEEENEETKQKFKEKLQHLQKELEESKEMSFNLEKTRRNSVTKVSQTMFHKLLSAEQSKNELVKRYEAEIKKLEDKLAVAELERTTISSKHEMHSMELNQYKEKTETLELEMVEIKKDAEKKERVRRESFSVLQKNYWKKLLEAEDDHGEQVNKLKHEVVRLQDEITAQKQMVEWLTNSKNNLLVECNKQMDELRRAVQIYEKKARSSWF